MVWNPIGEFLRKRRARLRKAQTRLETQQAEDVLLAGYEDQIRERTMRVLAERLDLPADDLVAGAAVRGENAVVSELGARFPEDEVARTWGQTRARIRRDLILDLRRPVPDRPA